MRSSNTWCIPSNSGRNEVSFEVLAWHDSRTRIEYSVRIVGKFWYRGGVADTARELLDDFRIELPSVFVPAVACEAFLHSLSKWPNDYQPIRCALASEPDQKLAIEIGQRVDLLTTCDRPAVTVFYEAPSLRVEIFFVADQSCLAHGRTQLEAVLSKSTE